MSKFSLSLFPLLIHSDSHCPFPPSAPPAVITSLYILSKMNSWKASCVLKSPPLQSKVPIKVDHHNGIWTIEEQSFYVPVFCSPLILMCCFVTSLTMFYFCQLVARNAVRERVHSDKNAPRGDLCDYVQWIQWRFGCMTKARLMHM